MIRLGVCASADQTGMVAAAGFDYIECALSATAALDGAGYASVRDAVLGSPIRAEVFNLMLPGGLPVTGPDFNLIAVRNYLDAALPRAAAMGCRVIVFGSGGARRVPEGYGKTDAYDDLIAYLRAAGDRCERYGVTIAIEPLNAAECNIINSVAEATWLANRANHPAVKVLSDNYHSEKDGLSFHEVRASGCLMAHTHVSHPNRSFPKPGDGYCYGDYFDALYDINYDSRMSVEGRTDDFANDLIKAYAVLDPLRRRHDG